MRRWILLAVLALVATDAIAYRLTRPTNRDAAEAFAAALAERSARCDSFAMDPVMVVSLVCRSVDCDQRATVDYKSCVEALTDTSCDDRRHYDACRSMSSPLP